MSAPPFSEDEKRFLLAEILKRSSISINTLLGIIRKDQIVPNWPEIWLPQARNLNSCQVVFEALTSNNPGTPQLLESTSRPTLKRRLSEIETPTGLPRYVPSIHPKLAPNGPNGPNGAQFALSASPAESTTKKRGRPTKEVLEARRAEVASRGPMYPPLKAAGRKSLGETPMPQLSLGPQGPASEPGPKTGGSSDSPLKKKRRGRPVKEIVEQTQVRQILEPAPHVMEIPKIPFTEDKDLSRHTPGVVEATPVVQNPPPPVLVVEATAQETSESSQPQITASLPPTQP